MYYLTQFFFIDTKKCAVSVLSERLQFIGYDDKLYGFSEEIKKGTVIEYLM